MPPKYVIAVPLVQQRHSEALPQQRKGQAKNILVVDFKSLRNNLNQK